MIQRIGPQLTPIPATSGSGADGGQWFGKPVQFAATEQDMLEKVQKEKKDSTQRAPTVLIEWHTHVTKWR